MNEKSSGALGLLGAAGAIALYFILRPYVPSLGVILLIAAGLLVLLLAVVIFFAFYKPKKTPREEQAEQQAKRLQQARAQLVTIRQRAARIRQPRIHALGRELHGKINGIMDTLKEHPEDIPRAGQLFHYYLPTVEKILKKYEEVERSGVPAEGIAETTAACLEDAKAAMEKLHASLFEDDILDLTVEMETLKQICQRDGLLTEKDFAEKS